MLTLSKENTNLNVSAYMAALINILEFLLTPYVIA